MAVKFKETYFEIYIEATYVTQNQKSIWYREKKLEARLKKARIFGANKKKTLLNIDKGHVRTAEPKIAGYQVVFSREAELNRVQLLRRNKARIFGGKIQLLLNI